MATRRQVLRGAVGAGSLAAAGGLVAFPARRALAADPQPAGTTLASTIEVGPAGAGGYRLLVTGPGEAHVVRDDLAAPQPTRAASRLGLLGFVQLTDIHLVDAQSPARVEYLDRYDDDENTRTLFSAAYRPQEILTTQVGDALLQAVRAVSRGPVSGLPLAFTICTGDNTDNQQRNELRWQIDLLDGEALRPTSGDPGVWEGVHDQNRSTYDVHYWHPDGTPDGAVQGDDNARSVYGFPTVPGLLVAATRAFTPVGTGMPWYTAYGNHDGLVQGNFPMSLPFGPVATGSAKATGATLSQADALRLSGGDVSVLTAALAGPARVVTADADRAVVSRREYVEQHFRTAGTPVGHGFDQGNLDAETAYYTIDAGPVLGIVLDTVNPNGESNGSLDTAQFAWLEAQLRAVHASALDAPGGARTAVGGRDRLVVVFSHHTIATMNNQLTGTSGDPRDTGPRVLGPQVRDLLLRYPNVVLWVNGHTHRNDVLPHARPSGAAVPGGFWELNTASHIDWPQQARLVELLDNRDGTLSIFGTIVDSAAPLSYAGRLDDTLHLAALSRELAANDWQGRTSRDSRRGPVEARNVELVVPTPFVLDAAAPVPAVPESTSPLLLPLAGGAAALAGLVALRRRGSLRHQPVD